MRNFSSIGVQIPEILLPKKGIDLSRWAVIACDQFSSEPEYWREVEKLTEGVPTTYNMILPEVMLGSSEEFARIQSTQQTMRDYLDHGIFEVIEGLILVERQVMGKTRKGIMLALDLECYDFHSGSQTLIRATEGTILDRLPPRIRIREGAPLELPHILVLIDDPEKSVIEPIYKLRETLPCLYDFELMLGSGHLKGYRIDRPDLEAEVIHSLEHLADPQYFQKQYSLPAENSPLLFAMGDGNHSFATAKAIWEKIKLEVGPDHPARYALVEVENVHDDGLEFEPIHRVLFDVTQDLIPSLKSNLISLASIIECQDNAELKSKVDQSTSEIQKIGFCSSSGKGVITLQNPQSNLPVGNLQIFLDEWQKNGGFGKIDYVHGWDSVTRLGMQPGCAGFFLPAMKKTELFKTVILDGALPRKTFSMGEAREKRFYLECRKITA
jgi:Protein of unknown function (DUF1015)